MRIKTLVVAATLAICTAAGAQMAPTPSLGPIGTPASPAKAIDIMLSMYESEAMGAVKAMPADKYSFAPSHAIFAPTQGEKFEGVRTFAQQAAHVAQANYFFFSTISGVKPDVDMKAMAKLTDKESIVAALAGSFEFGHKAIATITPANAFLVIKGADGLDTRATVATFAVAHGYDHYGQMVEYLRMNGITPPASAK